MVLQSFWPDPVVDRFHFTLVGVALNSGPLLRWDVHGSLSVHHDVLEPTSRAPDEYLFIAILCMQLKIAQRMTTDVGWTWPEAAPTIL